MEEEEAVEEEDMEEEEAVGWKEQVKVEQDVEEWRTKGGACGGGKRGEHGGGGGRGIGRSIGGEKETIIT